MEQLPEFDADKRKDIVMHAVSREAAVEALADWDVTLTKLVMAVEGAHASVVMAADGLKGVREGLRSPKDLGAWIGPALRVGLDLVKLLGSVGIQLKGIP